MNFRFGKTVEVWRTGPKKFGDVAYVKHHLLPGSAVAPRYSSDADANNSSRIIVGFSLYVTDILADVQAGDRIVTPWDGNHYKVVGEAASWTSPFTGKEFGVEAALERVT